VRESEDLMSHKPSVDVAKARIRLVS